MTRSWGPPVDRETAHRRAAGRRHYNSWRQDMALRRRSQVAYLLGLWGPLTPGVQRQIAAHLHVSEATVSRDVAWLRRLPILPRIPEWRSDEPLLRVVGVGWARCVAKSLTTRKGQHDLHGRCHRAPALHRGQKGWRSLRGLGSVGSGPAALLVAPAPRPSGALRGPTSPGAAYAVHPLHLRGVRLAAPTRRRALLLARPAEVRDVADDAGHPQ